jgi:hypothetical protein
MGQLQELGEIWVRGKGLAEAIADAEDDFYQLYNKLNTDRDYQVACGYMSLEQGSMIMSRSCIPAFLEYYTDRLHPSYTSLPGASPFGTNTGCSGYAGSTVVRDLYGTQDYYMAGCDYMNTMSTGYGYAPLDLDQLSQESISALIPEERRKAYYRNVMKVIYSDQRLLEQAERLARLYQEMADVQHRYAQARTEKNARRAAAREAALQAREETGWAPINPNPRFQ